MVFSQSAWKIQFTNFMPAGIYLLKFNSTNTRTRFEICSKLTKKITERQSGVFTINFEYISKFVLVFLSMTLNKSRPIGVYLLLAFLLTLNRYFCFSLEKSNHFYGNRLSYSFLSSLLKKRSCVLLIILTSRYYVEFPIEKG